MRLALNTFCYEVGHVEIERTMKSASRFGFTFIDYAAFGSGDPITMPPGKRRDVVKMFKDLGLRCSQLLLMGTGRMAAPDKAARDEVLDYMRKCGEFQLELGGRQVLVCWGCGIHETSMLPQQAWLNSVSTLRSYAEWALDKGILIDLELDPHVYFIVNDLEKMGRIIEDVGMKNVFPNIDIGHLAITREGPERMEKHAKRILHVHISETDTFDHTNSIIGSGCADFKAYLDKVVELGIEENCARYGEEAVAGIEMGEPRREVDDPDRWMRESLAYLAKIAPALTF